MNAVRIDEFLNDRGIEVLQRFQDVWMPGCVSSGSKSGLLRGLRTAMLDQQSVGRVFSRLSREARRCLRLILRTPAFRIEVGDLLRKLPGENYIGDVERQLEALAQLGLAFIDSSEAGSVAVRRIVGVPEELAEALIRALGIDRRSTDSLLSLRAQQPTATFQPVIETADDRIARLSPPGLRSAIPLIVKEHGGILPQRQLDSVGLEKSSDPTVLYRAALEKAQLGTLGGLVLWEFGLDVDETCLVIYQEIADALLAQERETDLSDLSESRAGADLLCDLRALIDYVADHRLYLTAAGELHKAAARRAAAHGSMARSPFHSDEELFGLTFRLALRLRLLEADSDGLLRVAENSKAWADTPLTDQLLAVGHELIRARDARGIDRRQLHCRRIALELVRELDASAWYPAKLLARRVICRFLLETPVPAPQPAISEQPSSSGSVTLKQLEREIVDNVLGDLHAMGVLDAGLRRRAVAAFRLGELAARAYGRRATPPEPAGRILIVNPDFEVITLPEGSFDELLYRLCRFCERRKSDQTYHLKLTRASVERGAAGGLPATEMIRLLSDHSRVAVPQNVSYSIEQWAGHVRLAAISEVWLLEAVDADTMDLICTLPAVKEVLVRRVAPTAAVLYDRPIDPKTLLALKRLGVYLRGEV